MKDELPTIKNRNVIFKTNEEKTIDYAEALAKTITGGKVEEYLLRHGLYKETATQA